MSDYVLFSPLGLSDPTRGNYDGAFLHILRHYQPEKAYLYMTKRISSFDLIDNRYEVMGKRLASWLDFSCEIIKLKHEEVGNPQNFEFFYKPFEGIIRSIISENPGKTILINVSSGTPAMKLACCMIATIATTPLIPIQVVSFRGEERNMDEIAGERYDIENEWANLIDNSSEYEPENRCAFIPLDNLAAVFSREIILSLIQSYEYGAALNVAERIRFFIDPKVIFLLTAGKFRLTLNLKEAKKEADEAAYDLFPIKAEPAKKLFEFILYLSVKVEKGELADFTRGISPVITELFKESLTGKLDGKKSLERYCDFIERKKIYILRRELMPEDVKVHYDRYFSVRNQSMFMDSPLAASNILPLILFRFGEENEVSRLAKDLRDFEAKIRNPAAHILTEVTDEWIKDETGMTGSQVLKKLMRMFVLAFRDNEKNMHWDSYTRLNDEIARMMKV